MEFEWDIEKDAVNQLKHHVSFADTTQAFFDPRSFIVRDEGHSKGENGMSKRIRYTDAPPEVEAALLRAKIVEDFLPPPDQLRQAPIKIKITIALNKNTVDFFKRQAQIHHVKYQTMIDQVLEAYADRYSEIVGQKT
jgi:hypothetical protein